MTTVLEARLDWVPWRYTCATKHAKWSSTNIATEVKMIYMHIYRLVELKKLSNKVQTAKSETLGFYLIMGTLLTKLAMLKCQFIRRTHCSNRSCFSGRPTKGLPLRGHFHFLLTSCAGAAAATPGKLVLSAKGRLVCSWTKAFCSKLLLFSCNSPFPFSLSPLGA